MSDVKGLLSSKTFWGSTLMVVAFALQMFQMELGETMELATQVAGFFGYGFAIYGRVKAVKKIG